MLDVPQPITASEWFWLCVRKSDTCWVWAGAPNGNGYGRFCWDGTHTLAHRYAWELTYGPIPRGLYVCHDCDNPPCVRPDHLFLGTPRDNMQDAVRKGRFDGIHRPGRPRKHPTATVKIGS